MRKLPHGNGFLIWKRDILIWWGRLYHFDEYRLNALIHDDAYQSTPELVSVMDSHQSTIVRYLFHVLSENNKNLVNICVSLLPRHRSADPQYRLFLFQINTGNEKWCFYAKWEKIILLELNCNKKPTPRTKAGTHPYQLMYMWRRLLWMAVYCQQFRHNEAVTQEKMPEHINENSFSIIVLSITKSAI